MPSTLLMWGSGIRDSDILLRNQSLPCVTNVCRSTPKVHKSIAPVCTRCILGKFNWRPFRPTAKKAGSSCEKVHMNIKGPMDMTFIVKHLDCLIFVDAWSGADCCSPDPKEIGCSQTLQRTCWTSLELNRHKHQLSEIWQFQKVPYMSIQGVPSYQRYGSARYSGLHSWIEPNFGKIRTVVKITPSLLKGTGLPKNLWSDPRKESATSRIESTLHELGSVISVTSLNHYSSMMLIMIQRRRKKRNILLKTLRTVMVRNLNSGK